MNLRRTLPFVLVSWILVILTIGNVRAGTHEYNIQPEQEVTVSTQSLSPPGNVTGNITVQGGLVDFYVSYPSRKTVFCRNQTKGCDFSFTISETGNYTFHFMNDLSAENVTVALDYKINLKRSAQAGLNVGASAGTATVIAPPPILPPENPLDKPESVYEKICKKYLDFVESEKIVKVVRDAWTYIPLRPIIEVIGILGIILLPVPLFYGLFHRINVQKIKVAYKRNCSVGIE